MPIIQMPMIRTKKSPLEAAAYCAAAEGPRAGMSTPRSGGRGVAAVFLMTLMLVGCDANNAQVDFRIAAGAVPSGIFRTIDGVTPLNGENDPDDWRTAPIYATSGFFVAQRASPNPARLSVPDVVQIVVHTDSRIPGGLQLVARSGINERIVLTSFLDIPGPGDYVFTFFASEILGAQARELWRLVLFDSRGEPVTYGDLQLEQ